MRDFKYVENSDIFDKFLDKVCKIILVNEIKKK